MLLAELIKNIQDGNFYAANAALCHRQAPKKFLFAIHRGSEYLTRVIGAEGRRNGDIPCLQHSFRLIQMWANRGEMRIFKGIVVCAGADGLYAMHHVGCHCGVGWIILQCAMPTTHKRSRQFRLTIALIGACYWKSSQKNASQKFKAN